MLSPQRGGYTLHSLAEIAPLIPSEFGNEDSPYLQTHRESSSLRE